MCYMSGSNTMYQAALRAQCAHYSLHVTTRSWVNLVNLLQTQRCNRNRRRNNLRFLHGTATQFSAYFVNHIWYGKRGTYARDKNTSTTLCAKNARRRLMRANGGVLYYGNCLNQSVWTIWLVPSDHREKRKVGCQSHKTTWARI